MPKCSVADCQRPIKYTGLCGMHYKRLWRHGDVDKILQPKKLPEMECSQPDCDRQIGHSNGLCIICNQRLTRYGRLNNILSPKGSGYLDAQGYWRIPGRDGNSVLEHRDIMEKSLGRRLTSEEVVHHIDEDKLNNDLSNLMLLNNQSEHMKLHWRLK